MATGPSPEILPTHTPALFEEAVGRAVRLLKEGQVVALPTETVYGLAANAFDPEAVGRIFRIKGRPSDNPIIVHVVGSEMARDCVAEWSPAADALRAAFWPGPLTVVLPRSGKIPDQVTAGGGTVGLRWPSHPIMQAVIRACGFPLAAPSANLSTRVSPTSPEHVRKALGSRVELILDGGHCQVGIESTVVDMTSRPPRVLRPGMVGTASLEAVIGPLAVLGRGKIGPRRSPGMMDRHYAPEARLEVWRWEDDLDLGRQIKLAPVEAARVHVIAHSRIPSGLVCGRVVVIPHDPEAFARALYAEWHACDEAGARLIVVEALPDAEPWSAIQDRLRRAARGGGD